jgi:hypothetical protein
MRNGAWRKFDIDEAITTSDRRRAEQAAKKVLPDEEEPGAWRSHVGIRIYAKQF